MPLADASHGNDLRSDRTSPTLNDALLEFSAPVAVIISRSLITSSFSRDDRFDWNPTVGLRVGIPDRYSFVYFERAPPAELQEHLSSILKAHEHQHGTAARHQALPERSLAWWFAQLVHYGLPIAPDRKEAQESLGRAIVADSLAVPLRLRELESRLRRLSVTTPPYRPGMTGLHTRFQPFTAAPEPSSQVHNNQTLYEARQPNSQRNTSISHKSSRHSAANNLQTSQSDQSCEVNVQAEIDLTVAHRMQHEATSEPDFMFTPHSQKSLRVAASTDLIAEPNVGNRKKAQGELECTRGGEQVLDAVNTDVLQSATSASTSKELNSAAKSSQRMKEQLKAAKTVKPCLEKGNVKVIAYKEQQADNDLEFGSMAFHTLMGLPESSVARNHGKKSLITFSVSKQEPKSNIKDKKKRKRDKTKNKRKQAKLRELQEQQYKLQEQDTLDQAKSQKEKTTKQNAQVDKSVKQGMVSSSSKLVLKPQNEYSGGKPVLQQSPDLHHIIEISSDESQVNEVVIKSGRVTFNNNADNARRKNKLSQANDTQHLQPCELQNTSKQTNQLSRSLRNFTIGKHPPRNESRKYLRKLMDTVNRSVDSDQPEESSRYLANLSISNSDKVSSTQDQRATGIRDYTGCGITEMSGGLHTDDTAQAIQSFCVVSPSPSRSVDHAAPAQMCTDVPDSPKSIDTDSDPPSLSGLFTSQETPEKWREKNKARIAKSYDPESVPALREALATLPAYLKTSMRHNSPDLSRSWTIPRVTNRAMSTADIVRQRTRSRSLSLMPIPRKRPRLSMVEIENAGSEQRAQKRVRFSLAQTEPRTTTPNASQCHVSGAESTLVSSAARHNSRNMKGSHSAPSMKKDSALRRDVPHIIDDYKEKFDQRTARRRARSFGPVQESVEVRR